MKLLKALSLFLMIGLSELALADHMAGGHFEYKYVGNNTYEISLIIVRDCNGTPFYTNPHLFYKNECGFTCTDLGEMQLISQQPIDYGCGSECSQNSEHHSFEKYVFRKNVQLSTTCRWIFNCSVNARNYTDYIDLSVVPGSSGANYYNYCVIDNSLQNNSPTLSGINLAFGCVDFELESMYTISDADGDQLVFDFIAPQTYPGGTGYNCSHYDVTYESGASASQPFPSLGGFALDPSNGSFSFMPTAIGTSNYAVRCQEYRNGNLIGTTIYDGMILTQACETNGSVQFGSFVASGNASWTVPTEPGTYCNSFELTSDEGPVTVVDVQAPPYVSYTVTPGSNGSKIVTLCADFPDEFMCQEVDISATVIANAGEVDCLTAANDAGDKGYYYLHKLKGDYCPEDLYFTNRSPTANPMPAAARAANSIWVGNDMPLTAPPSILAGQGNVLINGDLYLKAGNAIYLPACQGGGSGCVTISGDVTLEIAPQSCSPDCDFTPLNIEVEELFACGEEKLVVQTTGEAPFTYTLHIAGDTINSAISNFFLHDIVSELDNGYIPYQVVVQDAVGNTGSYSGQVIGTKRFYEPIANNKIYIDYPSGTPYGEAGYYYCANIECFWGYPAYFIDSVNTSPPWYGATRMKLVVYNSLNSGEEIISVTENLENSDDWTIDNAQFYWNGFVNNDQNNNCIGGYLEDNSTNAWFNYRLTARNCYNTGTLDIVNEGFDEQAALFLTSCFYGTYTYNIQKSIPGSSSKYPVIYRVGPDLDTLLNGSEILNVFPNPVNTTFTIKTSLEKIDHIHIYDLRGKEVMHFSSIVNDQQLDVRILSAGIYTLVADYNGQKQVFKLLKE